MTGRPQYSRHLHSAVGPTTFFERMTAPIMGL